MGTNKHLALVVATSLFFIYGCSSSGSGSDAPKYETLETLNEALGQSGLNCSNFEKNGPEDKPLFDVGFESKAATCTLDDEVATLTVFKDAGELRKWVSVGKTMGCAFAQAFGVSEFDYVRGSQWAISDISQTLTRKIAKEFGGSAEHVKC